MSYADFHHLIYRGPRAQYITFNDSWVHYNIWHDNKGFRVVMSNTLRDDGTVVWAWRDDNICDKLDIDVEYNVDDAIITGTGFSTHEDAISYVASELEARRTEI